MSSASRTPSRKAIKGLTLDQAGGPDLNRGKQLEQLAEAALLEFEELFEIAAS